MEVWLIRDTFGPDHTLGKLYKNQVFHCHSGEDTDRYLEDHPEAKIHGKTAIPCGRYELKLTFSKRFGKIMPELLGVPGYTGVRFHGGNGPDDTLGCPLLGRSRSRIGVFDCKEVNQQLIDALKKAEAAGEKSWVTVARQQDWDSLVKGEKSE